LLTPGQTMQHGQRSQIPGQVNPALIPPSQYTP